MSQEVGNQLNTGYECEACGAKIISSLDSEKVACPSCGHVNKCTPKLVAAVRPATPEVPPLVSMNSEAAVAQFETSISARDFFPINRSETIGLLTRFFDFIYPPAPAAPDAAARLEDLEDNEPPVCERCGDEYSLDDGKEPTKYCHPCAQERVIELEAALIREAQQETVPADQCCCNPHCGCACHTAQASSKEVMPSENQRLDTVEGESRAEPQEKTSAGNTGLCAYKFHDGSLCSHPKNSILHEPFEDGCHLFVAPQPTSAGAEPPRCPMNGCNSLMYPFEGKMLCSNIGCRYSRPLAEQSVVESEGKLAEEFYHQSYDGDPKCLLAELIPARREEVWKLAEAFHAAASAETQECGLEQHHDELVELGLYLNVFDGKRQYINGRADANEAAHQGRFKLWKEAIARAEAAEAEVRELKEAGKKLRVFAHTLERKGGLRWVCRECYAEGATYEEIAHDDDCEVGQAVSVLGKGRGSKGV